MAAGASSINSCRPAGGEEEVWETWQQCWARAHQGPALRRPSHAPFTRLPQHYVPQTCPCHVLCQTFPTELNRRFGKIKGSRTVMNLTVRQQYHLLPAPGTVSTHCRLHLAIPTRHRGTRRLTHSSTAALFELNNAR